MAFDARDIKQLEDGEYLTSEDHPGFRIERRGEYRTWTYRYRSPVSGTLKQIKLGHWPATSQHKAIAEWERYRQLRSEGRCPASEIKEGKAELKKREEARRDKKKAQAYTVKAVAMEYWDEHICRHRVQKGQTEVLRMFENMLGETGDLPAQDLTRSQAFDLINKHAGKRPVVAGYLRSELGAAWDHAIDAGRLPETCPNWWRLILRGKIKSKGKKIAGKHVGTAKRSLTPVETGVLIQWLPNFSQTIEDALTQYLWTCARGVEICNMEGIEVQQEGRQWWWTIPKRKTKNARHANATDLRIPLYGRALAVVLRRKKLYGDGYLYPMIARPGKVGPISQKTIQTAVWYHQPYSETTPSHVRPRLPVTHWAPHDLRRTSRTFLASLGCPGEIGEVILGHMLPGVEGVYNQYKYDAERKVWLKRLSEYLESLAQKGAAS